MMVRIFQVDAFTARRFAGNPAAVMLFDRFPDDGLMLRIAAENNLSETAFLVPRGDDFRLRWFTPAIEVPLCGHATLASAAVVMERLQPGRQSVVFHTASGALPVTRSGDVYSMNFPSRPSTRIDGPVDLAARLGATPIEVMGNAFNYIALLADEATVRALAPDFAAIARYPIGGVIVTAAAAPGAGYDFVSRYFAPAKGIAEDPVTGGAHTMLAPYWAARLGRTALRGFQASKRGGEVGCRLDIDRVVLEGRCAFYLEGTAMI